MKNILYFAPFLLVLMSCVNHEESNKALLEQLPERQDISTGSLSNGLQYIILPNDEPKEQLSLKLIIKAGSVHEQDDQQGIAHLVEHMAFNGTQLYPANSIIERQEKLGMVFGKDVNATTSYDITSYYLHLPNSKEETVNEAIQMLSQQAGALSFEQHELEKERPVVEEEWRRTLGLRARIGKKIQQVTLADSRYLARQPIGDMELVRHTNAERIEAFWHDWYVPNNMIFIAVGATNEQQIKQLLTKHFGHYKSKKLPLQPDLTIPLNNKLSFTAISDKEITTETVALNFRFKQSPAISIDDYRQQLVSQLAMLTLSDRFRNDFQAGGEHLNNLSVMSSGLAKGYANTRFLSILIDESYDQAIQETFREISRYAEHGFTEQDLLPIKKVLIKGYETSLESNETVNNATLLNRLSADIRWSIPHVSFKDKVKLKAELIKNIALDEVNNHLKQLVKDIAPAVIIQVKEQNLASLPSEQEVDKLWNSALTNPPEARAGITVERPLFDEQLEDVKVVSYQQYENIHVWSLENGTEVWFQHSDKLPDTLRMRWQGVGGTQHLPEQQRRTAQLAVSNIPRYGYNGFDVLELEVINAGKSYQFGASASQLKHQIAGSSTKDSFETWMQNFYLQLTKPQVNSEMWQARKQLMIKGIEGAKDLPGQQFSRKVAQAIYANQPSLMPITSKEVEPINSQEMFDSWQAIFASADQHQMIIVGNAQPDWVINIAKQYVGNLPKGTRKEDIKLPAFQSAKSPIIIKAELEPKATTQLGWNINYPYSEDLRRKSAVLSRIVKLRIREQLREVAGGVYTSSFSITADKARDQLIASLSYSHQPERAQELKQMALTIIAEVVKNGITPDELAKVKEQIHNSLQADNIHDSHRLIWVARYIEQGEYYPMPEHYLNWLDNLTPNKLEKIAGELLSQKPSLDALLMPK